MERGPIESSTAEIRTPERVTKRPGSAAGSKACGDCARARFASTSLGAAVSVAINTTTLAALRNGWILPADVDMSCLLLAFWNLPLAGAAQSARLNRARDGTTQLRDKEVGIHHPRIGRSRQLAVRHLIDVIDQVQLHRYVQEARSDVAKGREILFGSGPDNLTFAGFAGHEMVFAERRIAQRAGPKVRRSGRTTRGDLEQPDCVNLLRREPAKVNGGVSTRADAANHGSSDGSLELAQR